MISGEEIAQAAHAKVCGENSGHDYLGHMDTSTYYAKYLFQHGYSDVTGDQVVEAILALTGYVPGETRWPGHPHPDKLIEYWGVAKR